MLKLSDIRLKKKNTESELRSVAAEALSVCENEITELRIQKLSIDARRRHDIRFVYTILVSVSNENAILESIEKRRSAGKKDVDSSAFGVKISEYIPSEPYSFPKAEASNQLTRPVIAGTGPAGLFAALCLAEAGIKCIILERGQAVDERVAKVRDFWEKGILDEESNVQFGEGGAGTFSDGKLTTGVNDRRIHFVLERLVEYGAPGDILYLAKPHIGTDKLRKVVKAIRLRLIELGCDVRFGHKLTDIEISNSKLKSVTIKHGDSIYSIETDKLILAPGNSARDTFEMLHKANVRLMPKAFSVGVRIEHLQKDMDTAQYGYEAMNSVIKYPACDYKLAAHLENSRSVYTFCVCPGGLVVAAASEHGGVVTNGMSLYSRDDENINGALLVSITPDDFGNKPLGGIEFQRQLEQAAFEAGGNNYCAPAQLVSDFLKKQATKKPGKITPSYLPGVNYCNLWDVLPEFVCSAILEAIPQFSKRISCFSIPDAVMTAVETRSSSPVRIERENYETVGICGIFPCGEGAGYAGGIMSAAVDAIRCAEAIILQSQQA